MKVARPCCLLATALSVGCSSLPGLKHASTSALAVSQAPAGGNVVVVDSQQGGDRLATVKLPAVAGKFTAQAIQHRWVAQDILQELVTLAADGKTIVTVKLQPEAGQDECVFDNLRLGVTYTVTVVALGNPGGDPNGELQVLNTQHPAVGTILFQGDQDVDEAKNLTIELQLDSTLFQGSATVSVDIKDGDFIVPSASESGKALAETPGNDEDADGPDADATTSIAATGDQPVTHIATGSDAQTGHQTHALAGGDATDD